MSRTTDAHLLQALTKAYRARAKLFHHTIHAAGVDLLIAEIDKIDGSRLAWSSKIGVSSVAVQRVIDVGGLPHQVFAHPNVIFQRPHLIAYYRNLVAISQKGISQLLFATDRYESRKSATIEKAEANRLCCALNQIVSSVIDDLPAYSVSLSRHTVFAEIGTQIQGTWANVVGQGAAKAVKELIGQYVAANGLGQRVGTGRFELRNGWVVKFGSEPDVSFVDSAGVERIAIEIKGSLDVNGAQTRYGEAKKSFGKALRGNPRCHTIYLASCFTDAVIDQIEADGQVRDWFNLTSIIYDSQEKQRFLDTVFHIVSAPRRRRA